MSGGQQAIGEQEVFSNPTAGAVAYYIQGTGAGVTITQPVQGGNGGLTAIAGRGTSLLEQNGILFGTGAGQTRLPIGALQLLTVQGPGLTSPTTVLPAPDFSITQSTGYTTLLEIVTATAALDWTGGFAAGRPGAVVGIFNYTSSGAPFNIVDLTVGGSIYMPYPYMALGFQEAAFFRFWNGSWNFLFKNPAQYSNGGLSEGSRVVHTTDATPTMLYRMNRPNGPFGSGFTCDIVGVRTDTNATIGQWMGGIAAWNETFTQSIGSGGNLAFPVTPYTPTAATVTVTYDGTNFNVIGTGLAGVPIRWLTNNFRTLVAPNV